MKDFLRKPAQSMTIGDVLVYVWLIMLTVYGPILAVCWVQAHWNDLVDKVRTFKRKILKK